MGIKQMFKKVASLENYIALIVINAKYYQKVNIEILDYLVNSQKNPGVYVTVNKPCFIIQRDLEKARINSNLLIFIDCITHVGDFQDKRTKGCLLIGNPEHLTDISIAIDQAIHSIEQKDKFVYFDSISTLLIHNQFNTVAQFCFYLAGKIRQWKIKGVFLTVRSENDKELINVLTPFCDARFDIKG